MDQLLTINQAAEILEVSRATVYNLMNLGRLGFVRVSDGARRIDPKDLQAYIETNRVPPWSQRDEN